jgi:hypothetical protein
VIWYAYLNYAVQQFLNFLVLILFLNFLKHESFAWKGFYLSIICSYKLVDYLLAEYFKEDYFEYFNTICFWIYVGSSIFSPFFGLIMKPTEQEIVLIN